MLFECENCRECTVTGICAYTGENFAEKEQIEDIEKVLAMMSKRDQRKAESLGLCEEIASLVKNCEGDNSNRARLVDLSKLRKWEIMEEVGNYLDPRGEEVEDWHHIKRLATFCKAFSIPESKINEYYALAICEWGYEIAYTTQNPDIVLVLWEEETTEAESEQFGESEGVSEISELSSEAESEGIGGRNIIFTTDRHRDIFYAQEEAERFAKIFGGVTHYCYYTEREGGFLDETDGEFIGYLVWSEKWGDYFGYEIIDYYYPLEVALMVSQSKPSSLYNLSKGDKAKGYYFTYEGLEVPFKVLLNENQKTEGIAGLCFGTAKECPSQRLGLCQLPDDSICYARAGESRATKRDNEKGLQGMDSYYNGVLCGEFWDRFATDSDLRVKFMDFLDSKDIETLRFNLKGDFRSETDILAMYHLANMGYNCTCYTARDDLSKVLEMVADHPNIWVNGSNRFYTNRFKATTSLKEYLEADFPCLGSCSSCRKCYTLRGCEIVVLVHGSGSDTLLNDFENFEFLRANFKPLGVTLKPEDFERAKGLTTCLNKALALRGCPFGDFKGAKDILKFIQANKGAII